MTEGGQRDHGGQRISAPSRVALGRISGRTRVILTPRRRLPRPSKGTTGHFQGLTTTMAGTPKWWDGGFKRKRTPKASPEPSSFGLTRHRGIAGGSELAGAEESETRFKTYAQAMPNQVWAATPDGELDWFNDQVFSYKRY